MLMRRDGSIFSSRIFMRPIPGLLSAKMKNLPLLPAGPITNMPGRFLRWKDSRQMSILTRRQKQILSELCDGKTYKEIGRNARHQSAHGPLPCRGIDASFSCGKQVSASCKSPESAKIKEIIHQRSRYGCFFHGRM